MLVISWGKPQNNKPSPNGGVRLRWWLWLRNASWRVNPTINIQFRRDSIHLLADIFWWCWAWRHDLWLALPHLHCQSSGDKAYHPPYVTRWTVAKSDKPPTLDGWNLKKAWDVTIYQLVDFATIHRMLLYVAVFFSERPSFWSISWCLAYRLPQQFSQICRCFIGTSKDRNVNYHYFCNFSRNLLFLLFVDMCIYIYTFSIPSQEWNISVRASGCGASRH